MCRPPVVTLMLFLLCHSAPVVAQCAPWPLWESFKHHYLSDDGRVRDASTPAHITTSEGQSYALLFALAADDRHSFDAVLRWTENNLAQGNLQEHLPAWQWGHDAQSNTWHVLDANAASDADLWIAYALLEAARLWQEPRYQTLGNAVANNVLRDEVLPVPGLGLTLLPGPRGFVQGNVWRFNASYLPLPVLRRLASTTPRGWQEIIHSSSRIIMASAPQGFASDWISYQNNQFMPDAITAGVGSYNAIRVYLWTGMTHARDADNQRIRRQLMPAVTQIINSGLPFESVNITGDAQGNGPPGFSAAFIPLLAQSKAMAKATAALNQQIQRARRESLKDDQHYYSDVLTLFGLGWLDGWLRFAADGKLTRKGSAPCQHQ